VFQDFANVWTPVMPAKKLGRSLVPFTLAGERIVLFRDGDGKAAALVDRCPHRGAALSLGKRSEGGCVECPFHGWTFDGSGKNAHVPFNPDAKRETLGATPLPTREIGGLVWVHTAPGTTTDVEPNVPEALLRDDVHCTYLSADWSAHWTRAMENMLDYPHLPFVHRSTIGRDIQKRMTPQSTLAMGWHEQPWGARITVRFDDDPERDILEYLAPNGMALLLAPAPKLFRIHAFCIPTEPGKTRMLIVSARAFAKLGLLDPLFDVGNRKILGQDRAVVESSQPPEVPPPSEEASVATDRPTLAFRRHYFKRLKGSNAVLSRKSLLRAS
jgi:nitrite reductase/ring-hydroxylating ferredoxin subunit